jgi:hypothetical protein
MLDRIRELRRKHRRPPWRLDLSLSIPMVDVLEELDSGLATWIA